MSVPKYHEFYNALLESLSDGKIYYYRDCFDKVKHIMHLTSDILLETMSSGETRWINRASWSCTYLKKAGLIDSPKRAHLQITECGRQLLSENVIITDKLLSERFPDFAKFKYGDKEVRISNESIINNETPQELLDRSYQEITAELSDELLTAVLNMSPEFFERLVVKLMGAFAGPPKIEKGLYITTAKFSKEAKNYADAQHIILVDGKKLTELMIEFDVGVSTQKIYKIKRVDNDFFNEQ